MSTQASKLKFWEHPGMLQPLECLCLGGDCSYVFYITRTKDQPYPYILLCPQCGSQSALPVQEERDWLIQGIIKKSNDLMGKSSENV